MLVLKFILHFNHPLWNVSLQIHFIFSLNLAVTLASFTPRLTLPLYQW